jgi:hypothetical protein
MRYLRRKLTNAGEYLHPAHLRGLACGNSREQLRDIRRRLRPQAPAHAAKQDVVRDYARRFGANILIETGTFRGDMVHAMLADFAVIHTIELSPALAHAARARFSGDAHVSVHEGDSSAVLPGLLAKINEPCLFWLDGHSSGGETALGSIQSPILAELATILRHAVGNHVILVDDAREFAHGKGYPSLQRVQRLIQPRYAHFTVTDDIIRITA